jgi:hypothetical protein
MKSMYFIHFVVEFKTLKFTLAIEKVEIFNEILYVEIRYLRKTEKHYIKIKDRYAHALVKSNSNHYYYTGFIPYWISNLSNHIKIYQQTFNRLIGTIYYRNNDPVIGVFLFSKKLEELFCARLLKYKGGKNFKVIIRIK